MTYSFDGTNYLIVFQKDEELLESLQAFAAETNLKAAWLTGIGGAQELELGYFNLGKREYRWRTFAQLCEITSLHGTLALDDKGEPVFHLHGTFADETYQTVGGHVRRLVVGGTCEVMAQPFNQALHRRFDGQTGLRLLDL